MARSSRAGWTLKLAGLGAAAAMLFAACGSDDNTASTAVTTPPAVSSADTVAPVDTGGTDTVGADTTAVPATDAASGDTPTDGGTLTIRQITDLTSMDPVSGNSGFDQQTLYPVYDRLINVDPETLEPKPGLAKSWEFPDARTLMLTLQDGVKFQDGTPFDADAVKFNLDRAKTLETSTIKQDVSMIDSVDVVSPNQVKINLNRDDTSLVLILSDRAGMMVSPTAAADPAALAKTPVGAGAFKFKEWVPGDHLTLEKNPDYWQAGLPHLDGLTFRFITPAETARNALQANEVDMALQMSTTDVDALKDVSGLTVSVHPSLFLAHCYLNFSKAPFDDVRVRQAVNFALDRDAINQVYTFGLATPAAEVFPKGYWAYQDDLANGYTFDPDKAKQLLADAGYADGLSITGVTTTSTDFGRLNEIVQSQLKDVGIDMQFEQQEPAAATSAFFTDLTPNIYCSAWSGRPDPSQTAQSLFGSPSFFNAGNYSAPGMPEALAAAAAGTDLTSRGAAFHDVVDISQKEALNVPIVHVPNVDVYSDKVGGFTPTLGKTDVTFLWMKS